MRVTDPTLLKTLEERGIDKNDVAFVQDYGKKIPGKSSPYTKFYRNLKTRERYMVVSGLPMAKAQGRKVEASWLLSEKHGAWYSMANMFTCRVAGTHVSFTHLYDQPNGDKRFDKLDYEPQVFLDGKELEPKSYIPEQIDDPINENYRGNVLEWDYGICKRRLRLVEGKLSGSWVFDDIPPGTVKFRYNQEGNVRLRLGRYATGEDEETAKPADIKREAEEPDSGFLGFPVAVSDTLTVYPDADPETSTVDGWAQEASVSMTWSAIRAAPGNYHDDTHWGANCGWQCSNDSAKWKHLYRPIILFDTSALPDGSSIDAATLSLYGSLLLNQGSWASLAYNIYSSAPASNTALADGDYDSLGSTQFATSISHASLITTDYNVFTLNATGQAAISDTGISKFGVREATYDSAGATPGWVIAAYALFQFYTAEQGAGYKPKLIVTYSAVSNPPTAETYDPTDIEAEQAYGSGNVSDEGDDDVDEVGFEWGTESGVYTDEVTEEVDIEDFEGPFKLLMESLSPSTHYYYRAKAHNTAGWGYGAEVEFDTSDPLPVMAIHPPTEVEDDSATLNGEITDVGDDTVDTRGFVFDTSSHSNPGNTAPGASDYANYIADEDLDEDEYHVAEQYSLPATLQFRTFCYVRAWAHNDYGYAYSSELKFFVCRDINYLFLTGDYSKGIRFSNANFTPDTSVPHYSKLQSEDASFTDPGPGFGYYTGQYVFEMNWYNHTMKTDLYTLADPTNRTSGVVKVKWKAKTWRTNYPYGDFQRALRTHSVTYMGSETPCGQAKWTCEVFRDNPNTGTSWTVDELDALLGGIALGNDSSSWGRPMCDILEILALWTDAAVRTDPATVPEAGKIRAHGYVLEDEAEVCNVHFQYGLTDEYGSTTTPEAKAIGESFYADITTDVPIHYRAVIETTCGETFYGDDYYTGELTRGLVLELAFGQSIFTEDPEWTEVSEYVMQLATKRGRMHELDKIEAGTATFLLNNATGDWWRYNTGGAFYPDVKPLTLIRLRYRYGGTIYPLWYGVTESFKPGWLGGNEAGSNPVVTIEAVDIFKTFSRYRLVPANPVLIADAEAGQNNIVVEDTYGLHAGQSLKIYDDDAAEINYISSITQSTNTVTMAYNLSYRYRVKKGAAAKKFPAVLSGTRISDILYEVGWPAALAVLDAGQVVVVEHTPGSAGTNCLEHMQKVAEAEMGIVFVRTDGKIEFQDSLARTVSPYDTSQMTFKDDGNDSLYVRPEILDDDTFIFNEAEVSGEGIDTHVLLDLAYQTEQGPRVIQRANSLMYSDDDAFNQAWILVARHKDSLMRCQSLLIFPDASMTDLYPKVMGYDLSTRLTFQLDTATNPSALDLDYHIEGIAHEWDALSDLWKTQWQLWDVNKYQIFLDNNDGYLTNVSEVSYEDCHDAAEASGDPENNDIFIEVGQWTVYAGVIFSTARIQRAYIEFDTSAIDPAQNIESVLMLTYVAGYYADRTWQLRLVDPDTVDAPVEKADYGTLEPLTDSLGSVSIDASGWLTIELNASGIAHINKGGITKFGLRSSRDCTEDDPGTGSLEWCFIASKTSDYKTRLIVKFA